METSEFRRPINIVFLALAVLSLMFGSYYYHISKRFKEISFQVDQVASKIFDSKNTTSCLHLLDKDSLPITEDVFYIRGKIWNSGNLSIQNSDIRMPLTINIENCNRILDFKIEKQYEDSTQGFTLNKINNKCLKVNWRYFDPNNGFSYQIIYLGKEQVNFSLNGKLLDVSDFKEISNDKKGTLWYIIAGGIIAFLFGLFADRIFPALLGGKSKISFVWRLIIVIICGMLISFFIQIYLPKLMQPLIPF